MFPNEVMLKPETWTSILRIMQAVQAAHGWDAEDAPAAGRVAIAQTSA
jgi:hypothetical protein